MLLGWAVDKEIVFDGSWRHDNSWYERHLLADIGIISPFEKMKSANLVIGHDSTNNNYIQKVMKTFPNKQRYKNVSVRLCICKCLVFHEFQYLIVHSVK